MCKKILRPLWSQNDILGDISFCVKIFEEGVKQTVFVLHPLPLFLAPDQRQVAQDGAEIEFRAA